MGTHTRRTEESGLLTLQKEFIDLAFSDAAANGEPPPFHHQAIEAADAKWKAYREALEAVPLEADSPKAGLPPDWLPRMLKLSYRYSDGDLMRELHRYAFERWLTATQGPTSKGRASLRPNYLLFVADVVSRTADLQDVVRLLMKTHGISADGARKQIRTALAYAARVNERE